MMEKELLDYVAERADILAESGASKQETKDAAIAWKNSVAGASDADIESATAQFVDFLEGCPNTIDGVIAFAQGPAAELMGQEAAEQMLAAQLERKAQGEKWCSCDACTAAVEILTRFDRI